MAFAAVNGVTLHYERNGAGGALVLLHGFTGSTEIWTPLLPTFARDFDTIAIDLLGHGASAAPPAPTRYAIDQTVADLCALLDQLGIARALWLGYSMGGRVALHVAIARPERVSALVLESSAPGIQDPAARQARLERDRALADEIEREGTAAFVARWEQLPLFASQARLPATTRAELRRQRLANNAVGLANSLRGSGQGACPPVWDRLAALTIPVLLIAGAEDAPYRLWAEEMARVLPLAETAIVEAAGHAVHLEQGEQFAELVLDFLGRHPA
jgi:2-succinyl-6-hydroxy-2,4-cyclohexadiene-1-carboxylate synthase